MFSRWCSVAPASTSRATSASRSGLPKSRWMRFLPAVGSGTFWNAKLVALSGTATM
ncbi:Uncharacterised protein [Mycobacteroides abscessus subsp. abscessus]|nr:Uncharacterised protein [Mycobacteroides abscessus subsp. abscessus]